MRLKDLKYKSVFQPDAPTISRGKQIDMNALRNKNKQFKKIINKKKKKR